MYIIYIYIYIYTHTHTHIYIYKTYIYFTEYCGKYKSVHFRQFVFLLYIQIISRDKDCSSFQLSVFLGQMICSGVQEFVKSPGNLNYLNSFSPIKSVHWGGGDNKAQWPPEGLMLKTVNSFQTIRVWRRFFQGCLPVFTAVLCLDTFQVQALLTQAISPSFPLALVLWGGDADGSHSTFTLILAKSLIWFSSSHIFSGCVFSIQ